MKTVSIYSNKEMIRIHRELQTPAGFWIASDLFYVLPSTVSWNEVIQKTNTAFGQEEEIVMAPENWSKFNREFLRKMNLKSLKQLHTEVSMCRLELFDDGSIDIIPHNYLESEKYFEPDTSLIKKVPSERVNNEILINGIKESLNI